MNSAFCDGPGGRVRFVARLGLLVRSLILCSLALASAAGALQSAAGPAAPTVHVLPLEGPIGPASLDYLTRGLARAQREHSRLVVLRIDTPGGLATSTRSMVQEILASPVPVVAWVAPGGARAASAGAYLVYASHVAAMAPGTNLGAATPVAIGAAPSAAPVPKRPAADPVASGEPAPGEQTPVGANDATSAMARKIVNDSAAYLRSLAQLRGRNVEWAEKAVREGASLSAEEAVAQQVVDLIAADLPALLAQVDGRQVTLGDSSTVTLHTRGAQELVLAPDWRTRLLSIITNPSIAYVMLLIGAYGIFIEVTTPGFGVPGIAGAVLLIVGLFAMQMLPVSFAGVGLIALGLALIVAEALLPSFGALGIGGSIAFLIGSILLFDTDAPGFGIPIGLIVGFTLLNLLLVLVVVRLAFAARRRPVLTGAEELLGARAEVEIRDGECWVRVHGEHWQAVADVPLQQGQRVRVSARDGLVLRVKPESTATFGVDDLSRTTS